MIFKNTIKRFVLEEVEKEYKSGNYAAYAPFMDTLLSRNTPLKSTNLDRRLIHYWESRKLFNEVSDNGYLSFFDVSWLNVLQELKVIGVTPKTMEEVHKFFFGNNSFLDALFSKSNIEKLAFSSKEIDDLSKSKDLLQMINHLDPNVVLNELFNGSFISISLYKIIYKVIDDNELFSLNEGVLEIKESSINIIKKMFNDDKIQKITFRLNDKRTPIMEVTKRLDFAEFYNKIHYLKKKGTFLDMQIKTRDGKVQLFEVTELINTK